MNQINFEIAAHVEGWGIRRGGEITGSYPTKEVALDAAKEVASKFLGKGVQVTIRMPDVVSDGVKF